MYMGRPGNQTNSVLTSMLCCHFQDEYMDGCTDGTWHERRYFTCPYGRGFFCPYNSLSPDRRFDASENTCGADPAVNRKEQNIFHLPTVCHL